MKNKHKKQFSRNVVNSILLFIASFVIVFIGFVLCNIFAITINCLFKGFDSFTIKLLELPYLLYLLFSLIFSIAFTLIIVKKSKL